MRRLLPLFLVLLLTLRGLLGDAMAMGTLPPAGPQGHAHASKASAPVSPSAQHGAHHAAGTSATHTSHREHSAPAPQAAVPSCNPSDANSTTGCDHAAGMPCSACGICHSAFSLPVLHTPAAHAQPTTRPASATARYASAQPQQLSKPPIS